MVLIDRRCLPADFHAFDPSKLKSTKCIGRDVFSNAFILKSLVSEREFFMLDLQTDGLTHEEIHLFDMLAESANFPESKEYQRQHLHCCTNPNDFEILGCAFDRYHARTLYRHKESGLLLALKTGKSSTGNDDVNDESPKNTNNDIVAPQETHDAITTEVITDQGGVEEYVAHKMKDCPSRQLCKGDGEEDNAELQTCASIERRVSQSQIPTTSNICAR